MGIVSLIVSTFLNVECFLFIPFLMSEHNFNADIWHALRYSRKPEDKMSAMQKLVQIESQSSPLATCNTCNTTFAWRINKGTALPPHPNLIRHIKNKNTQSYTKSSHKFTQAIQATTPKQQTLRYSQRVFSKEREISLRLRHGQKYYREGNEWMNRSG